MKDDLGPGIDQRHERLAKEFADSIMCESLSMEALKAVVVSLDTKYISPPQQPRPPAALRGLAKMHAAVYRRKRERRTTLTGNIVMVASEVAPWSRTSGLGDVMSSLPKALAGRGHRVMVVAPRYDDYPEAFDTNVRRAIPVMSAHPEVAYFHCYRDGVDWVFVDHAAFRSVKHAIHSGDWESVVFRHALLCRAALESVRHLAPGGAPFGEQNTVFVAHDWHAALLPLMLQACYRIHGKMLGCRAVMVVHDVARQGRGPMLVGMEQMGVPQEFINTLRMDDGSGEHMNMLKAGLMAADRWVAVSRGQAVEIQTEQFGMGLERVLRADKVKMNGVLQGVDYSVWSPERDAFLAHAKGYTNFERTEEGLVVGKAQCKAALQGELGLPVRAEVPLIGFVGQLNHQKGVDLICQAQKWLLDQDVQLVILGQGESRYEDAVTYMARAHPNKCKAWVGFSVKLAHRVTASCDLLLVPSRFEPSGVNSMRAQRYGTVPVVHAVGGLRDSVDSVVAAHDDDDAPTATGTGWTYSPGSAEQMVMALCEALTTYREDKHTFLRIQEQCMERDFSWEVSAEAYERVFLDAKMEDI
eukprot:CAMPEP_0114241654 /NCGR_PEP_ID=MMETSP0058-20121206/9744_1 /TAXON_ID=36894 /ORGANISM="Pyramimonas parkeae, CCMP726" /LENGTH=583 /DNA_ID=CAMNT_0001354187 /DNA_START=399 /DNA_END=2150 /DNA_ORIENTATION=+